MSFPVKKKKVFPSEVCFRNAIYHTLLLEIYNAPDDMKSPERKGVVWYCLTQYLSMKFVHRKPFLMECIFATQGNRIEIKKCWLKKFSKEDIKY